MLTLAIDTSGMHGTIALRRDSTLLAERALQSGEKRARTLVTDVHKLLEDFGCHPRDCELIAVSIGPGSFTGLRIGVVFAKTLAYATGCRLAGVETMRCIAENAPLDVAVVQVVMYAQREEVFVAEYERLAGSTWNPTRPLTILSMSTWQASLHAGSVVMGPALENIATDLAAKTGCRVLLQDTWFPRASVVAELGERAAHEGQLADAWTLEPLYVRKSAAEEKWDAKVRAISETGEAQTTELKPNG